MTVAQIDEVGGFITLREAARQKGTTSNALYLWARGQGVQFVKVGQTLLVKPEQVAGYERTWVKVSR